MPQSIVPHVEHTRSPWLLWCSFQISQSRIRTPVPLQDGRLTAKNCDDGGVALIASGKKQLPSERDKAVESNRASNPSSEGQIQTNRQLTFGALNMGGHIFRTPRIEDMRSLTGIHHRFVVGMDEVFHGGSKGFFGVHEVAMVPEFGSQCPAVFFAPTARHGEVSARYLASNKEAQPWKPEPKTLSPVPCLPTQSNSTRHSTHMHSRE